MVRLLLISVHQESIVKRLDKEGSGGGGMSDRVANTLLEVQLFPYGRRFYHTLLGNNVNLIILVEKR